MRLKVSPLEALSRIDSMVKEGSKFVPIGHRKYLANESKPASSESLWDVFYQKLASSSAQIDQWINKSVKELEEVFQDYTPIYSFSKAGHKPFKVIEEVEVLTEESFEMDVEMVEAKLQVLNDFYNSLSALTKTPLFYLAEKAQICFYNFMCQLKPSSDEAELCRYMFDFSIGERQEFSDIYAFIKGENADLSDEWPKKWANSVVYAYDGVNRKTNKNFRFPIFTKEQNATLALTLPSRFISGL